MSNQINSANQADAEPASKKISRLQAFYRDPVACLDAIAERLAAAWAVSSVVRSPSGAWTVRYTRDRPGLPPATTPSNPPANADAGEQSSA